MYVHCVGVAGHICLDNFLYISNIQIEQQEEPQFESLLMITVIKYCYKCMEVCI